MTERDLADHTYGKPGWSAHVDRSLREIRDAVKDFTNKQTEWFDADRTWKRKIEKRVSALEDKPIEDDDEISSVQSVDELRRKARGQRGKVQRMKRTAKIAVPALVAGGVALAELIREIWKAIH